MPAVIIRRTSLPTLAWCIQMHGNSARSLLVSILIPATVSREGCASCYSYRPVGSGGGSCIVAHCNDAHSPLFLEAVAPDDWCDQYERRSGPFKDSSQTN